MSSGHKAEVGTKVTRPSEPVMFTELSERRCERIWGPAVVHAGLLLIQYPNDLLFLT